ncbi:UDP-N-acetylmuramoyl-L-alanine--D-glutamate ligase [Tumebacillus algifaecis]|uniref:UDP-N-acetylmuramoylalanine--D-glutamate ligase n=1 Tax=Tumebacillus algifaecis TaxID=1214604 RepID=A0A223D2J1_9BACL|nr:UDP-N-acetylmuramoyl-L-alanine--D-glutamate ligase [Tumebacillus algifaecis]ASS75868.1 UDP-N-acetylmuramoyl-L-alanine--D-glutamate ligase [Tumebacillus algifaecis]
MNVQGKNVLVLGVARSGVAAARLLHKLGAHVLVNDQKELAAIEQDVAELQALGIEVIAGGHPEGIVHTGLDFVVKNPGIPYSAPPVKLAMELGISVLTEVEIAYRLAQAPIIGITGSNGKTTTTTLVGEMLTEANLNPVVAGNIGLALSEVVEEVSKEQWLVAELSSFQLMGTAEFRPKIGALLNIYPAHLDYHGSLDEYRDAKFRLFAKQEASDVAVLNWDQEAVRAVQSFAKSKLFPFSLKEVLDEGVYVKDGIIQARMHGKELSLLPVSEVALKGEHNLENLLAATAVALTAGADVAAIVKVARTFNGVEHRLEHVVTQNEVAFYNDSKSTNSTAATMAINTFADHRVVLIAGGLDRGVDFLELVPVFAKKVKYVAAIGEAADKLLNVAAQAGIEGTKLATLEEAVQVAAGVAQPGDVVLLSPACASWDMFASFEERGSMFKKAVHTL